ncbi:putative ribonuclease H-like domain-containing protein [Tanacetum coccineum]
MQYQEEGINYDEVFAPIARIEAIRLFLAYASFIDFVVYQMDVKDAFLYGKIKEEVYVCQPPRFEDPNFPDRVDKVEKALYGLHQAHRAWYKDEFYRRTYILFGITSAAEKDGIFISQDKYVGEILKKIGFTKVKTASILIETQKPLLKDEDGEELDVHMYRSMIGSLMYLTSSRHDIMFAVCACARYQVNPKWGKKDIMLEIVQSQGFVTRNEEIEELVQLALSPRIQPTDHTSDDGPSYESAFISEVAFDLLRDALSAIFGLSELKMEKLEDENVYLDFKVQSLIKERDNTKMEYKKLFDSIKKTRSQTQKEMDELIVHDSEKTYAYGAIRAENQNLLSTISELKIKLEKVEKEGLSQFTFGTINDLTRLDLVDGLPKFNYGKRILSLMRVASINGKKYILVIVDDFSRYTWVYFLRSKDETPKIIKKFITQAQLNYEAKFVDRYCNAEQMNTPSKEDLDNLFGPMFKEYYEQKSSDTPIYSAVQPTQVHEDSPSTFSIIIDTHEAPPVVTTSDEQTSLISLTEADEFDQEDTADFAGNA